MKQRNACKATGAFLLMIAAGFTGVPAWSADGVGADSVQPGFEMSVVMDRAEGKTIALGDYERAILRLPEHGGREPFANHTNLCVAHTMVGQYRHAQHHCEEAVKAAEKGATEGRRKDTDYNAQWAVALSNRGVLKARTGDPAGARIDFRAAIELGSDSGLPTHNMANLDAGTTKAIAGRSAKRR